jgi:hypothetical protein
MTEFPADDYDSPWKDVLEHAFPEFMAFYFPLAYAQIDWEQGHEFKPTELTVMTQRDTPNHGSHDRPLFPRPFSREGRREFRESHARLPR